MKITDEMIDTVDRFLGVDGKAFFNEMIETHGEISPVFSVGCMPHAVHFNEGMQVRNSLYTTGKYDFNLDDYWIEIVQKVLDKEKVNGV